MDIEDGHSFIKSLAYYVRTHERALANAVLLRKPSVKGGHPSYTSAASSNAQAVHAGQSTGQPSSSSTSSALVAAFSIPYFPFGSLSIKPAKLSLTPNQLYYLLSRFEELGVLIGSMNVRLENIHAESAPSNYVSFLEQAPRMRGRNSDLDSIHSVSSVRSVISSMSSMWSNLGLGNSSIAKLEKRKASEMEDLKYLYSSFTKIPCLRLAADHNIQRIAGYEEFPFDTAVPIHVFKNVTELEICNVDFRSIFGWDRLAEQLRSLTITRSSLDDPLELLTNIVLDDMDKRRHRSSRPPSSPVLTMFSPAPASRSTELARSTSTPDSPRLYESRLPSRDSPGPVAMARGWSAESNKIIRRRMSSSSPTRPGSSRRLSTAQQSRFGIAKARRRSSGSSTSSPPASTPRNSSSNLLLLGGLPPNKWRFLRHLSLPDNGLTYISTQSLFPVWSTLQSLDLSFNLFTEIPDSLASLVSLRALNLSNCMIESLHSLARNPLPAISVLNLRANRIISLAGIERLLSLERLDLRENKITDPTELARLTGMPDFQEVFVRRNPFTKSRPDYRPTIFNLFRKTPGYSDDISIDASGPSYQERRHLIDRVPGSANVPVIKPPLEDETSDIPPILEDPSSPTRNEFEQRPSLPSTPQSQVGTNLQRRRKAAKRRIVDITQDETPRSHDSGRPSFDSPDVSFVTAKQSPVRQKASSINSDSFAQDTRTDTGSQRPLRDMDRRESVEASPSPVQPAKEPHNLSLSSEQYRRRIEALKNDLGNGWLKALDDHDEDSSSDQQQSSYSDKDMDLIVAANEPANRQFVPRPTRQPGLVSSSRTLG